MNNYFTPYCVVVLLITGACNNNADVNTAQNSDTITKQIKVFTPIEITLTQGEVVSKPIKGGEVYLFDFEVAADQYFHVEAIQKEIDYKLTLKLPESDSSIIFDTPNGQKGAEDLYYISEKAGKYKIELKPFTDYAELAGFDIVLKTVRDATKEDRAWMKIYEDMRAADRLRGKKETLEQAVIEFEKLIAQWKQVGDKYQEAVATRSLGYTLRSLGKKEEAFKTFESVLPLWLNLGEIRYEAFTYLILADLHKSDKDYENAIPLTFKAIEKWKETGDKVQESKAYSDVASYYMMNGEHEKSKEYYLKSIEKANESGRLSVQGIMLREYGNGWQTFGDDAKVMEYYTKALDTYVELGHLPANALVCRMIGDFLFNKERKDESRLYFERALKIYEELGDEKMITSMKEKLAAVKKSI
jgi:tetratricopeptide (TPR) repeat protein